MNIKLGCYASRMKGGGYFTVEREGKIIDSNGVVLRANNLKKGMLTTLFFGLKSVKRFVSHEDLLVIELQNQHLVDWLSGSKAYKGYEAEMDKVFEVLESIDCRYCFVFNTNTIAKKMVDQVEKVKKEPEKETGIELFNNLKE